MEITELTAQKPRIVLLYRASTKKQTDSENDIPLQRNILKPWAEKQGYEFKTEFVEGGVSGFKVHAADRDALNEIKAMADRREFDILGIYMSDRLGRIANETPLVVEYLNHRGIKVMSYIEGEITSATHSDKLMNFIRFWQAESESLKTSARCTDAIAECTRQGRWIGGTPPYGYRKVLRGSVNFKGRPIYDLEIDPEQAEVVKLIYDLYVNKHHGIRLISNILNQKGYLSAQGRRFNPARVSFILHLRNYTGVTVLHAKGKHNVNRVKIESPYVDSLKIIEQSDWNAAQKLCDRNRLRVGPFGKSSNRATVHGRMMLTGIAYCGSCGRKLIGHYKYTDNDKGKILSDRDKMNGKFYYICPPSTEQSITGERCKPALWSCLKIDEMVVADAKEFVRTIDKEKLLSDYSNATDIRLKELAARQKKTAAELSKKEFDIKKLKDEVVRVIIGESTFSQSLLSDLIKTKEAEYLTLHEELKDIEAQMKECETALAEKKAVAEQLANWDEIFDGQSRQGKKGMLIGLIDRVTFYGDSVEATYKVDVSTVVNEVIENRCVTDSIAAQSPILTDIVCQSKPQRPITQTHLVTRRMPYVKGQRGKVDKNARRLGKPVDEAITDFCSVPRTQSEIVELVGLTLSVVRQKYIDRLIDEGKLLITMPFAPHSNYQRFVNADHRGYVKDDDAIVMFCTEPKTSKEITEYVGMSRATTLANLRTLIAGGKLKNITGGGAEHSGTGSKYVRVDL